jgi:dCMP deaminase
MKFTQKDYEYMELAESLRGNSPCVRTQVGAVFVLDGQIILTSHNGIVSPNVKSCEDLGGCIREKLHIKHGEHMSICYAPCAETRCICEAARDGVAVKGATVYCSHRPCLICTRNLAAAEVSRVIYKIDYPDPNSAAVAKAVGLEVIQIK